MWNQPSKVKEIADQRPDWITDDLIEQTIRAFQQESSAELTEDDAVGVILSLSQILEAVGLLKLTGNDEEVHGMGTSQ